jgi:NAD(P)-dependent dehydrogenase (short-subunit alcohol dehydrogenase family)
MRSLGYDTVILEIPGCRKKTATSKKSVGAPIYRIAEAGEASIGELFKKLTGEQGARPLAGFLHISSIPVNDGREDFDPEEQDALKTVFLCAKNFVNHSEPDGRRRFFVSAVRMDGRLGLGTGRGQGSGAADRPDGGAADTPVDAVAAAHMQGGLLGLHKALNVEWDGEIFSKAVDVCRDIPPEKAAEYLLEEVFEPGCEYAEVGRAADGKRRFLELTEEYPEIPEHPGAAPGPEDVFLVTGGGRGITAACAIKLAEKSKGRFILLGRTDASGDVGWTERRRDRSSLQKLALAKLAKDAASKPRPAEVNALVNAAINQMEVEDTLKAIRNVGGSAKYFRCDVTDEKAFIKTVAEAEAEFGRVTGIVHGAGNIADKKIQRKTAADFDNVFGTKIRGLRACLKSVDTKKLKYLVLFSSIAACFGNAGQSDYAMANEVMNKFAFEFKRRQRSCKVISVNWGLWEAGGMASDSIKSAMQGTDARMIPVEVGTRYFMEQFEYTQEPGVCQIVVNCGERLIRPDFGLAGPTPTAEAASNLVLTVGGMDT